MRRYNSGSGAGLIHSAINIPAALAEESGTGAAQWITKAARAAGTPRAFAISLALVVIWAVMGPFFHYSNTWQLTLNTRTTVLRFLMVLFIQHLQNRDSAAAHAKLNELIRASANSSEVVQSRHALDHAASDRNDNHCLELEPALTMPFSR